MRAAGARAGRVVVAKKHLGRIELVQNGAVVASPEVAPGKPAVFESTLNFRQSGSRCPAHGLADGPSDPYRRGICHRERRPNRASIEDARFLSAG
jgi:hypothetical protein